ncbi:MAG: hypothetical protein OZSIB_2585 [Candidatus Ozemobacter sibiricus]|jgi:hypothetical protein|uniref:Uncharacterized protein n=1 Tax=Candidatus Ozemobacter sibiricus TaxID=2268124 RepID=A0A367ZIB5_9BACT|nr:MAG: hypothetical protein OZSIB_2585 [Candidatus Ozemobacter sibiricus]
MMKPRACHPLTWILILSLFGQTLVPAFGQEGDAIQARHRALTAAYEAYADAVSRGAPPDETNQRLQAYLAAKKAYEELVPPASPAQPAAGASSDGSPPAGVSAVESSAQNSPQATVQTTPPAPTTQEKKSWFGQMFQKARDLLLGKPGSKEMPLLEKILWNVGRSLVPSLGVMLATALLAPLSPVAMIAGGILVGAALGGVMTYAYEKRMNARYRDKPKEDAKIWRDVSVSATIEAIMAPFNLATGGLFGMVGPTMGNAIYRVAATQAALSFAGSALSSTVGGGVKNLWAKYYFHYPEKIAAAEKRIDEILEGHLAAGTPLTEADIKELDMLRAKIDEMKGESYSHEDFTKDMKRAALSSVISGFAGSVLSDRLYTYDKGRWADRLSVRIFGSTAKGKALSSLVSTMPTNFAGGAANAWLNKSFINDDIKAMRAEQARYAPGTAPYEYYNRVIAGMEAKRDAINVTRAGVDTMLDRLAVRSAQLTVEALKYNLYDGPKARKEAIDRAYRQQDPEWQKAAKLYEKYQKEVAGRPDPTLIRNPANFARAYAAWNKRVEAARREWLQQCEAAEAAQDRPLNQSIRAELAARYDKEYKLNQMLELGRLQGGYAHVKAMKAILVDKDPKLAELPENELNRLAIQAIVQSYQAKAEQTTARVNAIEDTFKKVADYKAGRLTLSEAEARRLQGQAALISPSQYKAALVEQKVYAMKAQDARWSDVRDAMPRLLAEAEAQMVKHYGGWTAVLAAEAYANGLAKYKYNPDGSVAFTKEAAALLGTARSTATKTAVDDFNNKINSAIMSNLLPQSSEREAEYEEMMKTYARSALTSGNKALLESLLGIASDKILGAFSRR